jgi:peptidyl-prolyl cis-trans isomerase A (cyclophilin A)
MTIRAGILALGAALTLAGASAPAPAQTGNLADPATLNDKAPATYKAKFETSKGTFVIEVNRAWAPNGADRFYNLVKSGYFDDARFYRVVSGFMAQFGFNGDPKISAAWRAARIKDDPVRQSNKRGFVTYATSGPDSRTTQVFINFDDNVGLDSQGFAPFGRVVSGMDVVEKLNAQYGDGPPRGPGPDQARIHFEGNAYLNKSFPRLDFIRKATIEP